MYGTIVTVSGAPAEPPAGDPAPDAAGREPVGQLPGAEAPAAPAAHEPGGQAPETDTQWELWEVFVQEAQGAPHEHAGSVRATDAAHAIQNARDVYARRGKVLSMWVVPTSAIAATSPADVEPFFDPGSDKPYRHPHFYKAPRGVRGL